MWVVVYSDGCVNVTLCTNGCINWGIGGIFSTRDKAQQKAEYYKARGDDVDVLDMTLDDEYQDVALPNNIHGLA